MLNDEERVLDVFDSTFRSSLMIEYDCECGLTKLLSIIENISINLKKIISLEYFSQLSQMCFSLMQAQVLVYENCVLWSSIYRFRFTWRDRKWHSRILLELGYLLLVN
jgi:hypothetical protein